MTSLLAFIDFSKEDMPDISNHGATASPHGSCGVMNLVPVYLPSKGKFASVNPGGDINPGGFESGEFSVYVKMYLRPSQKQNQVIFSNGDIEDADSVILFCRRMEIRCSSTYSWVQSVCAWDRLTTSFSG